MNLKDKLLISAILVAAIAPAHAGTTAGFGFLSNYVFRGAEIDRSVAYASVDYTKGAFYTGAWLGDTATSELNAYLGLLQQFSESVSLGLGVTAYEYLDNSVPGDRQIEANLYANFGLVGLEYSAGRDSADQTAGKKAEIDYSFAKLKIGNDFTGGEIGHTWNEKKAGFDQSDDTRSFAQYYVQGEYKGFDMRGLIGYAEQEDGATNRSQDGGYVSLKIAKRFDF